MIYSVIHKNYLLKLNYTKIFTKSALLLGLKFNYNDLPSSIHDAGNLRNIY
jgi:hypothetical protein